MEILEERGVIGPPIGGSSKREIYLSDSDQPEDY